MYTLCTECKQAYSITVEKLRSTHGMIKCKKCSAIFDALELLSEGTIPDDIEIDSFLNHSFKPKQQFKYWGLGTSLLLVLFSFQIYFFEGYNLTQNTTLRPWLQQLCSQLTNCQLADYQNLDEISILKSSFEPQNNHYLFKTIFINQSLFAQKQPAIKLTLLDFNGHSFAQRTFYPTDYSKHPDKQLEPDIADKITLFIAKPSSKIGGYRFELI